MINKIRKWLYWHDWVYFVAASTAVIVFLIFFLGYLLGKGLQYNCNLEKRPSMYVSLMINDDPYAYEPEEFCSMLKQKMEKDGAQD